MSEQLQNTLSEMVAALAQWTGQTVETISTNLPTFLAKYGWYSTLSNLPWDIILTFLGVGAMVLIGSLLVCGILIGIEVINDNNDQKAFAILCKVALWIWISLSLIFSCAPILTTAVAPEIVGLEALIDLIKSAG